jgi:hypothetical protein
VSANIKVIVLSLEVEALFIFHARSSIMPAQIVAVTVSDGVIHVTVNSKLVPLLGNTSVGPEVMVPVVPDTVISAVVKLQVLITSSKTTLYVALFIVVGSV